MTAAGPATKRLHFEFHGDPQAIMQWVESVETFLLQAGCGAASAQQVAIVAEEILTNIVREAWGSGQPGDCTFDVEAARNGDSLNVSLRTEDDGVAFDPTAAQPPDLDAPLDERPAGGLGILLIRSMTDTQAYRRLGGRNIFEVTKTCPSEQRIP